MEFNTEKCGCCGACVSVCPTRSLELTESILILTKNKCENCGRCTYVCPLGAFYLEEN